MNSCARSVCGDAKQRQSESAQAPLEGSVGFSYPPAVQDIDESQLLTRCKRGDATAWNELFDLHYVPAMRFMFTLGHRFTVEDAEEICQEAFLSVVRNLHSFQGNCQFQTWLFRIAANKARDYREKLVAAKRGGRQTPLSIHAEHPETGLMIDPPSNMPGPDGALLQREQAGMIHEALAQIGDPCREIIELRYFGDLSYQELSGTLELNPKTVSSRLSKCLDRLEAIARSLISRETSPANPV